MQPRRTRSSPPPGGRPTSPTPRWRAVAARRFLYLIQEYEPFTFPMGTWAALAAESYTFPHVALFSSELLRGYFRAHGLGVTAPGEQAGERDSRCVSERDHPGARARPRMSCGPRRLARAAVLRPARGPRRAQHVRTRACSLWRARCARARSPTDWELHGIGTVDAGRAASPWAAAASLTLLPRAAQSAYGAMLREHDVGLALMYTPHPSLVPIEMASAGLLAVTTAFENKTPAAMAAISPNIMAAAPTVARGRRGAGVGRAGGGRTSTAPGGGRRWRGRATGRRRLTPTSSAGSLRALARARSVADH